MLMGTTAELAEFAAEIKSDVIPDKARQETKRAILDVIGTSLAGSAEDCGRIITEFVRTESGGIGEAAVIGAGFRAPASLAGLANGTMAHALDYDDVGLHIGHPSVAVVPAAIAAAEALGSSGKDFLDAVVIGYEIAGRIGHGAGRLAYAKGFHGTSVYGVFGAAAAVGRLMGLTTEQMRCAFGIAGSEASGLRANFGTMTKPLHAGETARGGVMAAILASRGYTADPNIIETKVGYGSAILGEYDLEAMTADLGRDFMVAHGVDIKKYPCCAGTHQALDAVLNLRARYELGMEDVDEITVEASEAAENLLIYPRPQSGLQGKFSMQYTVAAAMLDGGLKRSTFTDASAFRPEMREAIEKVNVNWTRGGSGPDGTGVKVRTKDGSTVEWETTVVRGSAADPLSKEELIAKFLDNAAVALPEGEAREVMQLVEALDGADKIAALTAIVGQARNGG
jgi:2-methylcitrate dehydratase PrpD